MSANPYDPVTTTDTTTLSDDDWGLTLPGVGYKNYYGEQSSRCRGLCQAIQERPKLSALICLSVVGVVMLIVIVGVTSGGDHKRHPTGKEPDWMPQTEGLEVYPIPEDKSIVITFDVKVMGNHDPIQAMLENLTTPYNEIDNLNEDIYYDCKADDSPFNKTCRLSRSAFGHECVSHKGYGYKGGMPCVFIQLNLPYGVMIRPITKDSLLWEAAQYVMEDHNDTSSVPLVCQGKTELDRKILTMSGIGGEPFAYSPDYGFKSYIYRKRNTALPFLKPAVMVQVRRLNDQQLVHVSCTAWGQLFNFDGSAVDHEVLSTEFAVYIKHGKQ